MAKVKVSTEVKAPVERVFELFTDIEHAAERVSAIEKIEVLSTGPFNLGYRWNETRQVMGRIDQCDDGDHVVRAESYLHGDPP